jgi:hypothetical protein
MDSIENIYSRMALKQIRKQSLLQSDGNFFEKIPEPNSEPSQSEENDVIILEQVQNLDGVDSKFLPKQIRKESRFRKESVQAKQSEKVIIVILLASG